MSESSSPYLFVNETPLNKLEVRRCYQRYNSEILISISAHEEVNLNQGLTRLEAIARVPPIDNIQKCALPEYLTTLMMYLFKQLKKQQLRVLSIGLKGSWNEGLRKKNNLNLSEKTRSDKPPFYDRSSPTMGIRIWPILKEVYI